jgi:hypothetical protein
MSSKRITHKTVAAALGLSRSRITQLVKRGMPIDSIRAARRWHATNAKEGIGHKGRRSGGDAMAEVTRAVIELDLSELGPMPPRGSLDHHVWVARRSHIQAAEAVLVAQERSRRTGKAEDGAILPGLLRALSVAEANRAAAEDRLELRRIRSGELVTLAHAKLYITNTLGPLMQRLGTFAKAVAPAVAASPDQTAREAIIEAALEPIRAEIRATLAANEPAGAPKG